MKDGAYSRMPGKAPRNHPLKKRILALIGGEEGRPLNKSEIARELSLPGSKRAEFRDILREMEKAGDITYGKKGRFSAGSSPAPKDRKNASRERKPKSSRSGGSPELVGKIRLNPAGHGWFMPDYHDEGNLNSGVDMSTKPRFYTASNALSTSLDGDIVRVRLVKPTGRPPASRQGMKPDMRARVIEVIERRSSIVTGKYQTRGKSGILLTDDTRVPGGIKLSDNKGAKPGQVVVVKITEWNDPNESPLGHVTEVLGFPGEPGVDVEQIIAAHGVARGFPSEVVDEAEQVEEKVPASEIERREDWRKKDVITIDPSTAKDFDDAIWVAKTEKGWQLAVHIADVSYYVKPGTALDAEARERGNSTYLVDRVIPMLPEVLSNGVCSLNPGVDRLTKCVVIDFDSAGTVKKSRFIDAIINTPRKYSYEEAQDILEDKEDGGKLGDHIREAWKLASVLRTKRFAKGGIDMDMPEITLMINSKGVPSGYKKDEYNESHQLIEEFMLAANESVAQKIKNSHRAAIYRIHGDPDPDRLNEFAELARSHGYTPGDLSNRKHIQELIDAARGSVEEHAIKLGLLKSMQRAVYSAEPDGHYGLAKSDYAHFTSPIRRYADLIVHRALQNLLENPPKKLDPVPKQSGCIEIAAHISETERTSSSAENESRRMKMLEWLELGMDYKEPPVFDAIVTEVRAMGLFMECTDIMQRGVVKREDLPEGHWKYEANSARFISRDGEFTSGTRLKVKVRDVDRINMRVDFEALEITGSTTKKQAQPPRENKRPSRKPAPKKRRRQ
ncbi:VacB/RNase II family 3'-5' exoribonuclease [Akkermansiaceae bacterium]|nr:VacB/RNase II family 3'-5' exoribonuclease [Akkermansiaceae bacterium]MDB4288423.1 VacB/RNase II family 3'-5' exoribonuclease [bacterium]MDB4268447.1 VacB/RNase II family 3'-5' exoribonuclease [Akkermansiaceae bacterium]MDB4304344.1 VacB/RNase II family 3'-5' exoribonuclease [Akkermansiaceae bacterium]MDB4306536.1 VacB/RNase II family 3'-5' exoribonuclease [bacterium]